MTDKPIALRGPWDLWFLFCLVLVLGEPALAVAEGARSYWRALETVTATFGAMSMLLFGCVAAMRLHDRLRNRNPR